MVESKSQSGGGRTGSLLIGAVGAIGGAVAAVVVGAVLVAVGVARMGSRPASSPASRAVEPESRTVEPKSRTVEPKSRTVKSKSQTGGRRTGSLPMSAGGRRTGALPMPVGAMGAVGGALAAVVVAAVLFAVGVAHFGSGSASDPGIGHAPITFPASLAGYDDATRVFSEKKAKAEDAVITKAASLTTAAYAKAYGGAATGFRSYANRAGTVELNVIGVRASSPGVTFGPVVDAASLDENAPLNQVVDVGDVSCLIMDDEPAAAGTPVNAKNEFVSRCQRSGPGLTVFVYGNLSGNAGRQSMVAMTNQAWAAAAES